MRKDEFPIIDKHVQNEVVKVLNEIKDRFEQEQYRHNYANEDFNEGIRFGLMLADQITELKIGEIKNG